MDGKINERELLLNLWLCRDVDRSNIGIALLKDMVKDVEEIYKLTEDKLAMLLSDNNIVITKSTYRSLIKTLEDKSLEAAKKTLDMAYKKDVSIIYPECKAYPEKLKNIYDCPQLLYTKGLPMDQTIVEKTVSIVGSRKTSAYGREISYNIAYKLAENNINIISGLAQGVDACSHKGCLDAGGYTIAVLGCGIDVIYPRTNYELYFDIVRQGTIISEYGFGVEPYNRNFPRRNRIISGISDGVLVVEARKKSGSLITADYALEQGKQIYAIPGRLYDANSEGTNNLIKQGAMLVTGYEDIIEDIFGVSKTEQNPVHNSDEGSINLKNDTAACKNEKTIDEGTALDEIEKKIVDIMSLDPIYIDDIVERLRIGVTKTINYLFVLEMKGYIKQISKGYYIKKI